MPGVDPRDPAAVADAVQGWAAERFGVDVRLVEPASAVGAGFDSYIHLVHLGGSGLAAEWGEPLVVRILPSVDRRLQASKEAAAQAWATDQGFSAPRVLAVLAPEDLFGLPAQVMERAPGVTMLDALKAKPWTALRLVDQLAQLQLRLHSLDAATWPAGDDGALVQRRLALPRRAVEVLDDPALRTAMERAESLVDGAETSRDAIVCHGDFHPLNVMVDGDRASVIDWTDAGLGPREADVARTLLLFNIAGIAATSSLERAILNRGGPWLARRYRRAYEQGESLDPSGLRLWEALHALHGWAQVEMLHAGAFASDSSSAGNEARVPRSVGAWLRARFDADVQDL